MKKKLFLVLLSLILIALGFHYKSDISFSKHDTSFVNTTSNYFEHKIQTKNKVSNQVSSFNIPFIVNKGQIDKDVKFYTPIFNGTAFITELGEITYTFTKNPQDNKKTSLTITEEIVGSKINKVIGESSSSTKINIFHGNDESKWKTNLPSFDVVNLGEIYDGIELKLKAYGNTVEKFFYVNEGGNTENIRVKLEGANRLNINDEGILNINTNLGDIKFSKPIAFQEKEGKKEFVEVAYLVEGNEYGFKVGNYDKSKQLVIDPILAATFVGGSGSESVFSVVQDSLGNIYVGGTTNSANFPGTISSEPPGSGPPDNILSNSEGFILKLGQNLQSLKAATYFGGDGEDVITSITVDSEDNLFAAGVVNPDLIAEEGFIIKLNSELDTLISSKTFNNVDISSIVVASDGDVYVAGQTVGNLNNIPIGPNSADPDGGDTLEGFIVKLSSDLNTVIASTYIGDDHDNEGSVLEREYTIKLALDSLGGVFITGEHSGGGVNGFIQVFIKKLTSSLSRIVSSVSLGGDLYDSPKAIEVDSLNNIYVVGATSSNDFPGIDSGSADNFLGDTVDGFIIKLDNGLNGIMAATYLGSNSSNGINDIAIDVNDNIYVTGTIRSGFPGLNFPGLDYSSTDFIAQNDEGFVSVLNQFLSTVNSTYIGGFDDDQGNSILVDQNFNIYVGGNTSNTNSSYEYFPGISGSSADSLYEGSSEGFVVNLDSLINNTIAKLQLASTILKKCTDCSQDVLKTLDSIILTTIDQLSLGDKLNAIETLERFINTTEGFIRSGALPKDFGTELIALANEIIADLKENLEVICSTLGDNKHKFRPDKDTFIFRGEKGSVITINFDSNPEGSSTGDNVLLKINKSNHSFNLVDDDGQLTKTIITEIKDNGHQRIAVVEQPDENNSFTGDYCLSIESVVGFTPRLIPTKSVE